MPNGPESGGEQSTLPEAPRGEEAHHDLLIHLRIQNWRRKLPNSH
jgi:hypothetical protein